MKSAGKLTAKLLVRKGGASPAGSQNITQLKPLIQKQNEAKINGAGGLEETAQSDEESLDKRIAMTLRLDGERHVKLRVLAALQGRSCQGLLTEALDAYLDEQAAELDPHIWRSLSRDNDE
ncbi:MAG: hypothetical protein PVF65_00860 [Sphingomonadales bacterium]|jgi:hypothetical protein